VQRLQRHHQLRGRAVWVGDDVLAAVLRHVGGENVTVDFRHDQRHALVVAPGGRIIDDDATRCADPGRPLLGNGATRAHQREIALGEVEILQIMAFERFVAEADFGAERAARSNSIDLLDRKLPLGEDVQHFPAHVTRGANDGNCVAHDSSHRVQ